MTSSTISHGDYEAAYQALFDDINASGGIHGRTLEPVFAPINPVGTDGADAACVELTEDEDVFVVTGFFLDDTVLCPLETHETAVVGGVQTPERLERADGAVVHDGERDRPADRDHPGHGRGGRARRQPSASTAPRATRPRWRTSSCPCSTSSGSR